jgi:hypothetical protein
MCPVRSVTYVSGRSDVGNKAMAQAVDLDALLSD